MIAYIRALQAARKSDRGASAVEYGILVAAIAAVIVAVVFVIGGQVQSGFKTTCTNMTGKTGITNSAAC
jgi:pilus assembly protein Flp/PilA